MLGQLHLYTDSTCVSDYKNKCKMNSYLHLARRSVSTASAKKMDFYYDVICPYSWFAFEVLQRYTDKWKLKIDYKPAFLGGIYKSSSNLSPGLVPARGQHMAVDLARCNKYFDVPVNDLNYDDMLNKGSVEPMRFLTAVKEHFPEYLETASRELWMMRFNEGKDFTTTNAIGKIADKVGLGADKKQVLLQAYTTQEVKDKLREITAEVVDKGGFGVPVIMIQCKDGEKFYFGSDRFPMIAEEIGEEWLGPRLEAASKL